MDKRVRTARAIDLYSGVGGWSLGLQLAGVEVVASYELWGPANETNFKNNSHQAQTVDIRRLALKDLPTDIDIVVGSPPCTQFSFSNRGGGGDLVDGLKDIIQFLTIVDHLKPRMWAMENVPRVAKIIEKELEVGGVLADFSHLGCVTHVVDMAEFGIPQRRRRCIAGNFDMELLKSYKPTSAPCTLGDIVSGLAATPVVDPIYGFEIDRSDLIDHVEEDLLSPEEVRINRANKMTHTVYNSMPFPDPMDRTVRTITATCTRVSRESIVIAVPGRDDAYRRLTLRERACLQGFPVTFQFYGANYGQKLRMIGNAIPPAFSYLMGQVLQRRNAKEVPLLPQAATALRRPEPIPVETPPDRAGVRYPANRTFKFAIPSLQLKSGVRFELDNDCSGEIVKWGVAFYFGTSKAIHSLQLDEETARYLKTRSKKALKQAAAPYLEEVRQFVASADIRNMQAVWTHRRPGGIRPFMLLDKLDEIGSALSASLSQHADEAASVIEALIQHQHGAAAEALSGVAKLTRNSATILAGLLIGSTVNPLLLARVFCWDRQKDSISN
ncbi:C-5 cytosine-specific DNA methylase [Acetobacter estunensis NRIC 0472]|nr:DNA (cytosine-5-)-methyltransferase [Acetobacter estunensis]GBQ26945.1 C-5 cytosine-specific DNA methylase [Acetobacter estunensis NRIC 0472]